MSHVISRHGDETVHRETFEGTPHPKDTVVAATVQKVPKSERSKHLARNPKPVNFPLRKHQDGAPAAQLAVLQAADTQNPRAFWCPTRFCYEEARGYRASPKLGGGPCSLLDERWAMPP